MTRRRRPALYAFIIGLLTVTLLTPAVSASNDALPDRYVLPGDEVFPEGVATLEGPNYFFVSSTTDGTIFRGQLHEPEAEVFLPGGEDGRTTAVGLAVDSQRDRLFVAGGATGMVWSYDLVTRDLIAVGSVEGAGFINDVTVGPDGAAYATDSMVPVIYRLAADASGEVTLESWLDLTGSPIEYQEGFNLNGIVTTPDGTYLLAVQSNTGNLFRITIEDGSIVQVDLGDASLTAADGLVMRGRTVSAVRNALGVITTIEISGDFTSGEVISNLTDPSFRFPTTAAILDGRLLVVNSQFNARESGTQVLPFTVSSLPVWMLTRAGL